MFSSGLMSLLSKNFFISLVFGMSASALYLSEPLPAWKLMAASLIMAGLAVNILWPKWMGKNAKQ
jgi:drug/metabolite transporter (DMT)-like permease